MEAGSRRQAVVTPMRGRSVRRGKEKTREGKVYLDKEEEVTKSRKSSYLEEIE